MKLNTHKICQFITDPFFGKWETVSLHADRIFCL